MKKEIVEMIEDKIEFLKSVEKTLLKDQKRNLVESLEYKVKILSEEKNVYQEHITIKFTNGKEKVLPATCNSNGANLKAIVRVVYGG